MYNSNNSVKNISESKNGGNIYMKWLDNTLLTLAVIGCIVWGLVGFFQFNLVSFIFGDGSWLSRIVYALVGLSGLYIISFYGRIRSSLED